VCGIAVLCVCDRCDVCVWDCFPVSGNAILCVGLFSCEWECYTVCGIAVHCVWNFYIMCGIAVLCVGLLYCV
jgi:hypothetical protein